jgi:signal recognition particle receptor subunit beta
MTINIVLFGPPLVGKSTLLKKLARHDRPSFRSLSDDEKGPMRSRIMVGEWRCLGQDVALQTMPGERLDMAHFLGMAESSDAILFVVDSQTTRREEMVGFWQALASARHGKPTAVMCTKSDLVEKSPKDYSPIDDLFGALKLPDDVSTWESSLDSPLPVTLALRFLVRAVAEKRNIALPAESVAVPPKEEGNSPGVFGRLIRSLFG